MNKIYKISTLILVGAFLFCTNVTSAQNLLINPSFETGELVPWTAGNNAVVTIIEDGQQGTYAAQGNIEQLVQVEAGVEYTYTAQVKCVGNCGENMWIGIKDITGDMFVANSSFTDVTEYEERSITFTAGTTGTHRFWVFGQNGADYVSDNFLLLAEGTTNVTEAELEANKIQIATTQEGVTVNIEDSINDAEIFIHDISGKRIYNNSISNGTTLINNSEFAASGIYLVSVQTGKTQKVEKVSILK